MSLNYSEIKAWAELTGTTPTSWEVSVLKRIDQVFLTEAAKK